MSKFDLTNAGFATRAIHEGQGFDKATGALSTPIYQTSTFCFESVDEAMTKFRGEEKGYIYSRAGNPTTFALEMKIAALEGGEAAVATSSGMGAIGSIMIGLLQTGDHVVCADTVYGGTSDVMRHNMPRLGIEVDFVDTSNPENVAKAIKENTKMVYLETPANPNMKVTDLAAMAKITKEKGIKMVVDNTFAPPPIQYPLKLGADIVLHSATKYLNGHGDVIFGVVVGSLEDIIQIKTLGVTHLSGSTPGPFESYLVLRGMKTLDLRVRKHCENALEVAKFLEGHDYIKTVYYPGLESHPGHEVSKVQMNGLYTGMVSFELKDDVNGLSSFEAGKKLLNNLKMIAIAVSLGDPDSLIQHPASMTHLCMTPEERAEAGISDGLIRFSVGLENVEDIIKDLQDALDAI